MNILCKKPNIKTEQQSEDYGDKLFQKRVLKQIYLIDISFHRPILFQLMTGFGEFSNILFFLRFSQAG